MCGNELPEAAAVCRFCGTSQAPLPPAPRREGVRTINLEAGRPTVDEGLARLEDELARARAAGVRVVRVIHGWGSSGKGGVLRTSCRARLTRLLAEGRVRSVVAGDDYGPASAAARALRARVPDLRAAERTDAGNPGITLVEL